MTSTPYHRPGLRAQLLEAAVAMTRERGVGEVSVRELARCAGVVPTAVYRHFRDRQDLLDAVAERAREECQLRFHGRANRDQEGRPTDSTLRAYIDFAREEPHLFEAGFANTSGFDLPFDVDLSDLPRLSIAHGFATLVSAGPLRGLSVPELDDLQEAALGTRG